ncbi:WecB/TagA/CpsF family glycosyltransferase [Carnobacterium inhibens]|uniref:Glycosyl transferase n=1 Tax=Carnobacterium inhibens subsp. gilichinskyi TaxID=1266845 RepID=U5S9J1_9LACT|nr:WecB/TagA/CpsF family glycosyltransferase [Carnobacterium inhibens]AGY81959.1 glycosyl transferase [Carnobacterium inhibens subsp. gilichinskyi]
MINKIKKKIPVCAILGVNIAAVNMEWLMEFLVNNIKKLSGEYICVSNVHTTVTSYENSEYLNIQNGGLMALPDGGPLSSLGRKRGYSKMSRIAGPSLMNEIFAISEEKGYKHYFYGSTDETLKKIQVNLKRSYPEIQIVGMYSPPYRKISQSEDEIVVSQINDVKPDFVWVGLGAPKQEIWMNLHQGLIKGLMIGVGAGFDYYAGNIKRAPKWMQNFNLEWAYRLLQDPKRLFKRYLITNFKFIWLILINKKFK